MFNSALGAAPHRKDAATDLQVRFTLSMLTFLGLHTCLSAVSHWYDPLPLLVYVVSPSFRCAACVPGAAVGGVRRSVQARRAAAADSRHGLVVCDIPHVVVTVPGSSVYAVTVHHRHVAGVSHLSCWRARPWRFSTRRPVAALDNVAAAPAARAHWRDAPGTRFTRQTTGWHSHVVHIVAVVWDVQNLSYPFHA